MKQQLVDRFYLKDEIENIYFEAKLKPGGGYAWINLANQWESTYNDDEIGPSILEKLISSLKGKVDNWLYLEQHEIIAPEHFEYKYMDYLYKILEKYDELDKLKIIDIDLSENVPYKNENPYYKSLPLMIGETNGRHSRLSYEKILSYKPTSNNRKFDKKFLSFMAEPRWERSKLYDFLHTNTVGENTYFSYAVNQPFNDRHLKIDNSLDFPYNVDIESWNYDNRAGISNLYMSTFCNIVCESKWGGDNIQITEKTDKAIMNLQPFLLISQCGSLNALKKLGFKTFSDYWDESYDNIKHDGDRIDKVFETILYIDKTYHQNTNDNTIEMVYDSMRDILKHNFELASDMWINQNRYYYKEPMYHDVIFNKKTKDGIIYMFD